MSHARLAKHYAGLQHDRQVHSAQVPGLQKLLDVQLPATMIRDQSAETSNRQQGLAQAKTKAPSATDAYDTVLHEYTSIAVSRLCRPYP